MQKYLTYIFLSIIVISAFLLRIYQNTSHPAGFFCDEAGLTYEAYSLLTTGKDSSGNIFPFYFSVFSPRGPVAIYDQIPFVLLFGLSEFASRTASAFFGTVTIIIVFFLVKELAKNKTLALFTAFLTAISPWHIQFSRFGTENIRLPLYFSLFLLLFLWGIRKHQKAVICISIVALFFGFYSYTAADIFILPFIVGLVIIYRDFFLKNKRFSLYLFVITILCITPFFYQMIAFPDQSRFAQVSIFKGKTINTALVEMIKTYFQSYSPDFLFLKGDSGMPTHFITRFSVKGFGELYMAALPFFIIGLVYLAKHIQKKEFQLLFLWFFLYPLGSVVAGADGGGPFATRSIIGVVLFQILTAYGIFYLARFFKRTKKRIAFYLAVVILFIISFGLYCYAYFVQYPLYSEDFWGWQYGTSNIVHYFTQQEKNYDNEIMAPEFNAPEIFFKFYAPHDCTKCTIGLPQDFSNSTSKQLFAVTPLYLREHPEYHMQMQKRIVYPNGTTAFYIGEIKRNQ